MVKKIKTIDIAAKKEAIKNARFLIDDNAQEKHILYSRGKRINEFFTEDSKLYITTKEMELMRKGVKINRKLRGWDNISSRIVSEYKTNTYAEKDFLFEKFKEKYEALHEEIDVASRSFFSQFSLARLWNMSIIASIVFGMFSMTLIYKYLGSGASADELKSAAAYDKQQTVVERTVKSEEGSGGDSYIRDLIEAEATDKKDDLEKEIMEMVKGYPIEDMVPYIAKKDRTVAAFLVGIAKKESNWGQRVPVLNGQDCYNYWGYRGIRKLMGSGGHTCFNSRKDAVDTVAKRIQWLMENEELNTPEKMVIWKCGNNCEATGGREAADKWISDVRKYFEKVND